jgi:hypothetical protein
MTWPDERPQARLLIDPGPRHFLAPLADRCHHVLLGRVLSGSLCGLPKALNTGQWMPENHREVGPTASHSNRRLQRNRKLGGCDFLSGDTGLIRPTAIPSGSSMIA